MDPVFNCPRLAHDSWGRIFLLGPPETQKRPLDDILVDDVCRGRLLPSMTRTFHIVRHGYNFFSGSFGGFLSLSARPALPTLATSSTLLFVESLQLHLWVILAFLLSCFASINSCSLLSRELHSLDSCKF